MAVCSVISLKGYAQSCPLTTGVTASSTVIDGKNSVIINWDSNPSANRYVVYLRSVGNIGFTQKKTNTNSKTITGLTANSEYEVKIRTFCSNGNNFTNSLIFNSGTSGISCDSPSMLMATGENVSGYHSTYFQWDPVAEAKYYIVFYRKKGTSRFRQRAVVGDSLRVNNLALSSIYEWKVRSVCSWDQSFSNPEDALLVEVTTQDSGEFCDLPDNPVATNTTMAEYNAAELNWENIAGATGYFLQYKINGSGTPWNSLTLSGSPPFVIAGLSSNAEYDFRVQTLCNLGPRIRSEDPLNGNQNLDFVKGFFTSGSVGNTCENPQNFRQTGEINNSGGYESIFTWDPVPGVDHYRVNYWLGGRVLNIVTTTETSVTLSQLVSEYYLVTVQSMCTSAGSVESEWAPLLKFTPELNCVTPSLLTNTTSISSGFNVADLSWEDIEDAHHFDIRYKPVGADDWNNAISENNSIRIEYLQARTEYEWQVRSICSEDGNLVSEYSTLENFTTKNGQDCSTPSNLRSRSIRSLVFLRWNNVPGTEYYNVQYREEGTIEWTTVRSNFFIATFIRENINSTYEWRVQAVCSDQPLFASAYSEISLVNPGSTLFGNIAQTSMTNSTIRIRNNQLTEKGVQISPNPFFRTFNVTPVETERIQNIAIFDTRGNQVHSSRHQSEGAVSVTPGNLQPGVYIVKTTTNSGIHTSKVLLE